MSAEKVAYTVLTESPALKTLLGDRVFPIAIPEATRLPAVAYQIVGEREHRSLDSPASTTDALVFATLRFTAVVAPNDYGTLTAVMDAIRDSFAARNGTSFAGVQNVVIHSGQEGPDAYDNVAQVASRYREVRITFNLRR